MCGIFGMVCSKNEYKKPGLGQALYRVMRHRGPDDFGCLSMDQENIVRLSHEPSIIDSGQVVLAHWRLSILDLSSNGWQPMSTFDDRYSIVFNGEIYNHRELKDELKQLGWKFRSTSDTEVLLASYAQWKHEALSRLVGMFAFAILDKYERRIFLARDCFGIKPLFYVNEQNYFAFASEIKALLELCHVSRKVNPEMLHSYLVFGATDMGCDTMFEKIKHLPPAHYMNLSCDNHRQILPARYWQIDNERRSDLSFKQASERLREMFIGSVRLHLRSDVPVGAALSGGIDSSAIVMTMRKIEPYIPIHTFSYIAEDPTISEEKWVNLIGLSSGATMHKISLTAEQLVTDLDSLIELQDEPFGSTRIFAQQRVFKLAHENGIKVMIDGQGADELLAGYSGYLSARLASLVKQGRWLQAAAFFRAVNRQPQVDSRGFYLGTGSMLIPRSIRSVTRRLVNKDILPRWLCRDWFRERGVNPLDPDIVTGRDVLLGQLKQSLNTSLRYLLRYEDRNSMAYSIESRVPFLTPQLAEFIYSLPENYLIDPSGKRKAVFREAMRGIVPGTILDREDKIGFETPEKNWLKNLKPWVEKVISSDRAAAIPALKIRVISEEWRQVASGQVPFNWRVWRWLNLIRWAEIRDVVFD